MSLNLGFGIMDSVCCEAVPPAGRRATPTAGAGAPRWTSSFVGFLAVLNDGGGDGRGVDVVGGRGRG